MRGLKLALKAAAVAVLLAFGIIFMGYFTSMASYKLMYERQVRSTVHEMVHPSALSVEKTAEMRR